MISHSQQKWLYKSNKLTQFINWVSNRNLQPPIMLLAAMSVSCLWVDALLHSLMWLPTFTVVLGSSFTWRRAFTHRYPPTRPRIRRQNFRARVLLAMGLGLLISMTLMAHPAQAQFFGDAESWMQTNFGADTGDAIPLVFNVLRGLFLLYVGISLVRVINSARQDEDWQTIARTPLIIIIAVTAGDILTTLITG
ncbi:hypothetical protein N836_18520 [Leptolyngbya sp. Heron Island J]|uniref:hypothetical protein n=1 Tax=Leptolyngbya sp. Heron Island J TaxID=1385935 RepID=UPI0003B9DD14|nr:hypothetical protein [Leptolyngbya sp. Heron Island J]ESA34126.1 hypothetical protein N836_18520 [Leptolyngbya sp. Heron Island J]